MMHSLCHIPDNRPAALTPREQQALTLAQQGLPNRAIAASLQIQEGTVKKLLSGVYAKLGIQSRYDLFRLPQE
jgi:two-component system response regulator DesR